MDGRLSRGQTDDQSGFIVIRNGSNSQLMDVKEHIQMDGQADA